MKWASALQCAQAVSVTRVGDMSVIGECRFAMSAPKPGCDKLFPIVRCGGQMGHISTPIQLVKKLAGTLAECGAAKYHYTKIVLPKNIAGLPVAQGPECPLWVAGHSAVRHLSGSGLLAVNHARLLWPDLTMRYGSTSASLILTCNYSSVLNFKPRLSILVSQDANKK